MDAIALDRARRPSRQAGDSSGRENAVWKAEQARRVRELTERYAPELARIQAEEARSGNADQVGDLRVNTPEAEAVLAVLGAEPRRWWTCREVRFFLGLRVEPVRRALTSLARHDLIHKRPAGDGTLAYALPEPAPDGD